MVLTSALDAGILGTGESENALLHILVWKHSWCFSYFLFLSRLSRVLNFSRNTNVLTNWALIKPDCSCMGWNGDYFYSIDIPIRAWHLTTLIGSLIGFWRLCGILLGVGSKIQRTKDKQHLFICKWLYFKRTLSQCLIWVSSTPLTYKCKQHKSLI